MPSLLSIIMLFTTGMLVGCAAERGVTGIVVDVQGRPVRQAVVTCWVRDDAKSNPAVERAILKHGQVGNDAKFRFDMGFPPSDLVISATSPDLNHYGRLEHVKQAGNVVVVQ